MAQSGIKDMLDNLKRIRSGGDKSNVKIDQIEKLEMELRFFGTFMMYHHARLPDSFVKITEKTQLIGEMIESVFGGNTDECKTNLNVERIVSELLKFNEGNAGLTCKFEVNDSYLLEYMDYLVKNLNDAPRYLVRSAPFSIEEIKILEKTDRFLKQVKFVQKKMTFLRYLYENEVNGYVEHETLKGLRTQIRFMADNVGQFCLALWANEEGDDTCDVENKPSSLLCLIVIVELEMKKIFLSELKASKFIQSKTFKKQKLPKDFSVHLQYLLMYLRNTLLDNFPNSFFAQNIDVAIEFLLDFLVDVSNRFISGNWLNEILEKVGVLVGNILCVIQMQLLAESTIKDDISTKQILEKMEDLKAQVQERNIYLPKMAQKDIEDMLDHLRRIKSRVDLNMIKIIDQIEMELRFFRTFIKYNGDPLAIPSVFMKKKVERLRSIFGGIPNECKTNLNVKRLVSQLQEFIEANTSLRDHYHDQLNGSYDLSEYMDYLVKNLNDVQMRFDWSAKQIPRETIQLMKQVKVVQKRMNFLRYLFASEINGYIDHQKLEDLETRIQFMAENVRQFCLAIWVYEDYIYQEEVEENDFVSKPPYLLCLIMLVKLEMKKIFLGELKSSKFSNSTTFKNQKLPKVFSYHFHSLLVYLRHRKLENFPNNVAAQNIDVSIELLLSFLAEDVSNPVFNDEMLNEVLEKVGSLVGDILCVIHNSTIKDDTSKMNLWSMQILEKTENLKAELERYYKSLKYTPTQFHFPAVGGLSFLDSLLRRLTELLKSESGLDSAMKPHIVILEKELSSVIPIFRDVATVHFGHEILKDQRRRTINWAYEAEVAIDSILAQYNARWHLLCSLPTISKEIKHICMEVTEMWSENLALKPCSVIEPSKHLPIPHCDLTNDEEIVGFQNDMKIIIDLLIRGPIGLNVIPIVGMGGQGKTTCARKLYNNGIIASYFGVRTWCIISQTYNRRELLQEIFSQVTGTKDKGDKADVLADMLKKSLTGKRYLIVLDDLWDGMAWDDLNLCFPDDGNRSRIIVTTRLEKVGEHVKQYTDPYFLPFLTPKESCQLLQKKVFQQEDFPPELQDVSLAVAEKCKGLPLVVVLAAGILKKKKMEESWWHEVKDALFSYLDRETKDYGRATMQLSYDKLANYLKPCLLYMGMFREDALIPVSRMISLWIAEGFVQNNEPGRLEEAAEGYLMELISSNVVMVSKRRYNGKVKYCQVHDVVLHFCLKRNREEKFMLALKHYRQFEASHWKENRLRFDINDDELKPKFGLLGSETRKPFHLALRSLIWTNRRQFSDCGSFYLQCSKFRLLKVLDLSSNKVEHISSATFHALIHLKYLSVFAEHFDFQHLPYLETLIVTCLVGPALPVIFWKMEKLRHVMISNMKFDLENNKQGIFEESSKLGNLRILRKVQIEDGDGDSVHVLLQRCSNLQELDIHYWGDEYSAEICPKLESLTKLHILRISFHWSIVVSKLHLPSNLKKLVLTGSHIESAISFIAGLPSLEYLQLKDRYLSESEDWWCLGDMTFRKLKILKLVQLSISKWEASEESFPLLETLVIRECHNLEEIPLSFADIQTLKQIKVLRCNKESLEASAVQIKEEAEDIKGCDCIDLTIEVPDRSINMPMLINLI